MAAMAHRQTGCGHILPVIPRGDHNNRERRRGSSNMLLVTGATKADELAVIEPNSGDHLKQHEQ